MFPVSDVIPSRTIPVVTLALILVTSCAFVYQFQLDEQSLGTLVENYGATSTDISVTRLIVSTFLHAGWLHLAVNMLYLWLFGANVEDAFGRTRFLFLYVSAGVISALTHGVVHQAFMAPLVGASGAVGGILGTYLVLYPQSRVLTVFLALPRFDLIEIPAMAFIGVWFVLQLAADVGPLGVPVTAGAQAFWSHVVGFAFGILCGAYARWRSRLLRKYWVRGASR